MNRVVVHDAFAPLGARALRSACRPSASAPARSGSTSMTPSTMQGGPLRPGRRLHRRSASRAWCKAAGSARFSKDFGTAGASLLEAEVVTADGQVRIANACTRSGPVLGAEGRRRRHLRRRHEVTLRPTSCRPLRRGQTFKATSDDAFRAPDRPVLRRLSRPLLNPHWGEQASHPAGQHARITMLSQGLEREQMRGGLAAAPRLGRRRAQRRRRPSRSAIGSIPARLFWDLEMHSAARAQGRHLRRPARRAALARLVERRSGRRSGPSSTASNPPGSRVAARPGPAPALVAAFFEASRPLDVDLHFNKGLAGAPPRRSPPRATPPMNPAVLDAFTLAIIADGGRRPIPASRPRPTTRRAAEDAERSTRRWPTAPAGARRRLLRHREQLFRARLAATSTGATHYPRLRRIKTQYDPNGLFFVHHGVGSEDWSDDGFTLRLGRAEPRALSDFLSVFCLWSNASQFRARSI